MKRISNSLTRGLCVRLHCSSLAHFNITSPHPYTSAPARGEAISRVSTGQARAGLNLCHTFCRMTIRDWWWTSADPRTQCQFWSFNYIFDRSIMHLTYLFSPGTGSLHQYQLWTVNTYQPHQSGVVSGATGLQLVAPSQQEYQNVLLFY